jgi:hypothetical protein
LNTHLPCLALFSKSFRQPATVSATSSEVLHSEKRLWHCVYDAVFSGVKYFFFYLVSGKMFFLNTYV